jgi:hypothetical protein
MQQRVFGHLALHYLPGDEAPARRLLELLGCTLVDNGPNPGRDGFCTVLIDRDSADYAENLFFLSAVNAEQAAIEGVIRDALTADGSTLLEAYRAKTVTAPESISHIGLRYGSFDELERVLAAIERETEPGGAFAGRVEVVKYKARPGLDAELDRRIASSPVFRGDERPAFANYWVQCFVKTDLCGFGILALGQTFELDYVAEPFYAEPPSFGRPRAAV